MQNKVWKPWGQARKGPCRCQRFSVCTTTISCFAKNPATDSSRKLRVFPALITFVLSLPLHAYMSAQFHAAAKTTFSKQSNLSSTPNFFGNLARNRKMAAEGWQCIAIISRWMRMNMESRVPVISDSVNSDRNKGAYQCRGRAQGCDKGSWRKRKPQRRQQ